MRSIGQSDAQIDEGLIEVDNEMWNYFPVEYNNNIWTKHFLKGNFSKNIFNEIV